MDSPPPIDTGSWESIYKAIAAAVAAILTWGAWALGRMAKPAAKVDSDSDIAALLVKTQAALAARELKSEIEGKISENRRIFYDHQREMNQNFAELQGRVSVVEAEIKGLMNQINDFRRSR